MSELKKAFKLLTELKSRTKDEILAELKSRLRPLDEINYLINFIEQESQRGMSKKFSLEEEEEELIFPEIPELGI